MVNHLGKKPEYIHIVIEEIEDENWGFVGMLTDDYRKKIQAERTKLRRRTRLAW